MSRLQVLLLCIVISFHDFQGVGVEEWLCTSLTDEVSITETRVNLLTNHMMLS